LVYKWIDTSSARSLEHISDFDNSMDFWWA